jgi:hypothetical protein
MKVRIHSNSIRFRLKEDDIEKLLKLGRISEVLTFGAGHRDELSFTLAVTGGPAVSCEADGNRFLFYIPQHIVQVWLHGEEAGFSEVLDTGKEKKLKLIVEKDFPCDHENHEIKKSGSSFH